VLPCLRGGSPLSVNGYFILHFSILPCCARCSLGISGILGIGRHCTSNRQETQNASTGERPRGGVGLALV
jgi:hypothetical protein